MFYIFYGKDDFSLNQTVGRIKADLGDPQMLAVNTARLDGQKLTLSELKGNCGTIPFLSSYRLVMVDGLLSRFEPKPGKRRLNRRTASKAASELGEWEGLASYIEQMASTTVLILIDGKISGNNPLLKKLSPLAEVKAFRLLQGKRLISWVQQRVSEEGGSITPEAVDLLVELIGGNLWMMNNEILKLGLYAQGRIISEDDVKQLVGYAQETNIFVLVDAIVEGKMEIAQRMLHWLYQEGISATHILAMITRQIRLIARAIELGSSLPRQQLQAKLGLHPYALDKTLSQAKLYDFEHIRRAYDKLLEADIAIKTGKYNDQLALEFLVAELSSSCV